MYRCVRTLTFPWQNLKNSVGSTQSFYLFVKVRKRREALLESFTSVVFSLYISRKYWNIFPVFFLRSKILNFSMKISVIRFWKLVKFNLLCMYVKLNIHHFFAVKDLSNNSTNLFNANMFWKKEGTRRYLFIN